MKVILTIGSVKFLANDAKPAAQVADLLGRMTPLESEFWHDDFTKEDYQSGTAFYQDEGRCHKISIAQAGEIHPDKAAMNAFIQSRLNPTPEISQPEAAL